MGIDHIEEVNKNVDHLEHIEKFNPHHDSRGRFTSASGGGAATSSSAGNAPTTKTFSYNKQRCHATIIPGMTKQHLMGDEKHIGEMDGYDIYQIPSATFDQHGFIGIKKSVDTVEHVENGFDHIEHIEKFNPFHDSRGRFSSSQGMKTYSANPKTKAGQMAISRSTAAGYGAVMNVHRESKGENIRQNDNWVRSGQKPNNSQLARAQANAPKTVAQARLNAHTNRVKGTMGATETANAKQPKPKKQTQPSQKQPQQQQKPQQQTQTQQQQAQAAQGKKNMVRVTQKMQSGIKMDADFDQSTVKGALNKQFRGTAEGKDLTKTFDATKMRASDSYFGEKRYTNQVADMQGFNSPAKRVSKAEFDQLAKTYGDEFYRTVGAGTLNGRKTSAQGFKNAFSVTNDMGMNGPSGRVYGDGIYTVSAKMTAGRGRSYTANDSANAKRESQWYGDCKTTLKMTWNSKPNIVTQRQLDNEWNKLSVAEKLKFGGHKNTYACAKGYDALYTNSSQYMTVFNRSKIAILDD